jgi:hypothetical protein
LPGKEHTADAIARRLEGLGGSGDCFVISEGDVDGQTLPIREALRLVLGRGIGAVLSVTPGTLAFYEGETLRERFILHREQ